LAFLSSPRSYRTVRDTYRADAQADGDGFPFGNKADDKKGNRKKPIVTTPFDPFLDPPVAIVKDNFVILDAMHQKNEFGRLAGTVWSFALHAPSRSPICLNLRLGQCGISEHWHMPRFRMENSRHGFGHDTGIDVCAVEDL